MQLNLVFRWSHVVLGSSCADVEKNLDAAMSYSGESIDAPVWDPMISHMSR